MTTTETPAGIATRIDISGQTVPAATPTGWPTNITEAFNTGRISLRTAQRLATETITVSA